MCNSLEVDYNRKEKNKVRNAMFEVMKVSKKATNCTGDSIWLPGPRGICVNLAHDFGLLTGDAILVEQNKKTMEILKSHIKRIPNTVLHIDSLHKLKLAAPVANAFFDFNGSVDEKLALWFSDELKPRLMVGGVYTFNFLYGHRSNSFPKKLIKLFRTMDNYIKLKNELKIVDDYLVAPLALLKCIFNDTPAIFLQILPYGKMVTYTMVIETDITIQSIWPTLDELINMMDNPSSRRTTTKSIPAPPGITISRIPRRKKMTATQQLDALVKSGEITKRRAGAFKANLTRKHQAIDNDKTLSSGSAAAKKAHVSRRILASAKSS